MTEFPVTSLEEYADAFRRKRKVSVHGLRGRILRGRTEQDFDLLSDNPQRRVVMIMGADGLSKIASAPGMQMFEIIGYDPNYVRHLITTGHEFRLIVFPEHDNIPLATWDNVARIVGEVHPVTRKAFAQNLRELRMLPFGVWLEETNFNWAEVDKNGLEDPRYMTPSRFAESLQTACDLRRFLYHTVSLKELYAGDGYTYSDRGMRGMKEYIMPNMRLSNVGPHIVLPVEL